MKSKVSVCVGSLLLAHSASGNVVSSGSFNFNTITSGLDFLTVHSSETLKPGIFNLGVFTNYAANSLPYLEDPNQNRTDFNDSLWAAEFNVGVGLLKDWDIGVSFPYVIQQGSESNGVSHGEFRKAGNTEVRFNSKYRLLGDDSGGIAVIGTININRTVNNPFTGISPGPIYTLEVAGDTTINQVAVALNIGHRWTSPGSRVPDSFFEPVGNQLIASAAGSYLIPNSDAKIIVETFGSLPAKSTNSLGDRSASSLELIAGVKYDINAQLAAQAGAGRELVHGASSPDWRVYAGINYTFGPVFGSSTADEQPFSSIEMIDVAPEMPDAEPSANLSIQATSKSMKAERWTSQKIEFEFDSDQMIGDGYNVVKRLAEHLKSLPSFRKIEIEGHTDSLGKDAYNLKLSQKRADAIKRVLTKDFKIEASKIKAKGFGETKPIADNGNFQGRQENRRVEFIIRK